MDREKNKERVQLTFLLGGLVFSVVLVNMLIVYLLLKIFLNINLLSYYYKTHLDLKTSIIILVISSTIVGYGLSLIFGRILMHPINKVINGMQELAKGNFKQRLSFGKLDKNNVFSEVSESFNKMASELEHTDTLSSDFLDNFSHEFKTPIVSISGFTKLLIREDLTKEQQMEYLHIIDEESDRLAHMATSVLKLIKIENQNILSNVSQFNLSEQIRNCILLLESKWSEKNINLQLDFDEYFVSGNEEMIKQIWINLLDNAIKYTPEDHLLKVEIKEKKDCVITSVINTGSEISPENQRHIFNKFYQADKSHAASGNGIGLAIVKKIIELHKGEICVISGNKKTIFVVTLPKEIEN